MTKQLVIGIDPGNGNSNACARLSGGKPVCVTLQTSVARPVEVGQVGAGWASSRGECCDVRWGDERFLVGPGAWRRGVPLDLAKGDLYHTLPRRACLYALMAKILKPTTNPAAYETTLVFGLPTAILANDAMGRQAKDGLVHAFKGEHRFTVDGADYAFTVPNIKGSIHVVNQPFGAFMDWRLGNDLQPVALERKPGAKSFTGLIFDVGMGTLDVGVLEEDAAGNVRPLERFILGDDLGVSWLLGPVADSMGIDLAEADTRFREGEIRFSDDQLDTWLSELLRKVKDRRVNFKRFDIVIPTGGGALLLSRDDRLKLALEARGAAVHWSRDDLLTANVRGYWKIGQRKAQAVQANAAA